MSNLRRALLVLSCAACLPGTVYALSPEDLPQLIALDDRLVAEMAAPQLAWSDDGAHLTVAGFAADHTPAVGVVPMDGRPAFTVPGLAAPRIAFAPGGLEFAGWLQDPTGPADATYRLAIFDAPSGTGTLVPGVAPFQAPSPLVWLGAPQRIIALRPQGEHTALVTYDPAANALASLVATVAGTGTVLREAAQPGSVVVGTAASDGTASYFLIDVTTGIATNVPEGEALPTGTARAGLSPDGSLVAICREGGLWIGTPEQPEARHLLPRGDVGGHEFSSAGQPIWSPTSEHLAYAMGGARDDLTQVRLVTLGFEEVSCEINYAAGSTPPQVGSRVWVCMELAKDEAGNVIEPEWKTLKAELTVTSSPLPEGAGTVVRARSVGVGGDVVKRLSGVAEPPADAPNESSLRIGMAGAPQQQLMRSFTLPARRGLIAWSQGASEGAVARVKVTRRALILIGAPVPAQGEEPATFGSPADDGGVTRPQVRITPLGRPTNQ